MFGNMNGTEQQGMARRRWNDDEECSGHTEWTSNLYIIIRKGSS